MASSFPHTYPLATFSLNMKAKAKLLAIYRNEVGNHIIQLEIPSYRAIDEINQLNKSDYLELQLNNYKKQRSVEQNDLLWSLIDAIAKKQGDDPYDVYAYLIEKANSKHEYIAMLPEAYEDMKKCFRVMKYIHSIVVDKSNGDGKQVLDVYKCFYGSSKLKTDEMAILIDKALEVAYKLNIPIMGDTL